MADLTQVSVGEDGIESQYSFEVEGHRFSLGGSTSLTVHGRCRVGGEWMPVGTVSSISIDIALARGREYPSDDRDRDLAELADLLEATPVCEAHEERLATTIEDRIREIVCEEIDAAGLADEDHDHPNLADEHHAHYDLADQHHEHSGYADQHHEHY
jgi:hypothetical protein